MTDLNDPLTIAAIDGDPAAQYLDQMGALFDASLRPPCPDCGATWRPEDLGGLWAAVIEHEDTCPTELLR